MLEFLSNLYSNNLCSIIRIYELYEISKYIAIQKNKRNQIVQSIAFNIFYSYFLLVLPIEIEKEKGKKIKRLRYKNNSVSFHQNNHIPHTLSNLSLL